MCSNEAIFLPVFRIVENIFGDVVNCKSRPIRNKKTAQKFVNSCTVFL